MNTMDKLMAFVEKAITDRKEDNHDTNTETYKVFIGKPLCSVTQIYMDQHKVSKDERKKIVFENGFRILAKKMAEEFVSFKGQPKDFPIRVEIYTDFIVYGESQAGIFAECEEIFSDTIDRLSNEQKRYEKEELYNIFWSNISIYSFARNKSANLFKPRYQRQFVSQDNHLDRQDLNREIYDVENQLYKQLAPGDINVPALKLEQGSRNSISRKFRAMEKKIGNMEIVRNSYHDRSIDSYIACKKKGDALQVVYTLRSIDKYLIPCIFLPVLSEKKLATIADSLSERINKVLKNNVIGIKKTEWRYLPNEYFRLVYAILNTLFLRAFVEEIAFEEGLKDTTVDFIMYNYANDKEIERLFKDILDPKTACIFSLSELQNIIEDAIGESVIFRNISDIVLFQKEQESKKTVEEIQKVQRKIEKTVFNFSARVEKTSYLMIKSYLSPSYESIKYMEHPINNILGSIIQGIYCFKDSWIRKAISIENLIAYLLQMIDLGCLDIRFYHQGDNKNNIQCIKFNGYSKSLYIYRYAQYLPFLNQIQWRCRRQGRNQIYGLMYEYIYFLKEYENYMKKNDCFDYTTLDALKSLKFNFFYIVHQLYYSGMLTDDYMYLVEKKIMNLNVSISPQEYIKSLRELYIAVVY